MVAADQKTTKQAALLLELRNILQIHRVSGRPPFLSSVFSAEFMFVLLSILNTVVTCVQSSRLVWAILSGSS